MNGTTNGHSPPQRFQINTNTGVSVGIIVLGFAGFFTIMNVLNAMKAEIVLARTETASLKMEVNSKIDKTESRINGIEGNKSALTTTEFFKWAIHLQQANSDAKKLQIEGLKVPEPEVSK